MPGPRKQTEFYRPLQVYKSWSTSASYPNSPNATWNAMITGSNQIHDTQGNPYRLLGRTGNSRRIGGNFHVTKRDYAESNSVTRMRTLTYGQVRYEGRFSAAGGVIVDNNFPTATKSSDSTLDYFGTKAIANVTPTNPLFSLSTALGELREGLPKIVGLETLQTRTARAKGAGSEYLNVEFGWKPLISDLQKFHYVTSNADALVKQYESNSGKRLKRRMNFPLETSTTITSSNSYSWPLVAAFGNNLYNGQGKLVKTTTTTTKRWFAGCFTYYLPPYKEGDHNIARSEQIANYLYGTRITPDTLWNLTPWSWAADWVGNIGDIMTNVSNFAADGLVMPYGYIMETKSVTDNYTTTQKYKNNGNFAAELGPEVVYSQTLTTTSKCRRVATPFGFGLNPSSFTGRQWSILVALGLSRNGASKDL